MIKVIALNFLLYLCTYLVDAFPSNESLLAKRFPWYHTTDQIHDELIKLKEHPYASVEKIKISDTNNFIDIITVKKIQTGNKFFILAGEHARELIGSESALHFIKSLTGQIEELHESAENVLDHTEFKIIVNGNPISRKKVENGEFCLRVNENGVDLNRNWGDHWKNSDTNNGDTYSGKHPFSEPEVKIFRSSIKNFKPNIFLSIHSGTLGMYMPYAFSPKLPTRNEEQMIEILGEIDSTYCQCPFGSAGGKVGYNSYGTCLDYVYDKFNVPFAYAFEIYANKNDQEVLHSLWNYSANTKKINPVFLPFPIKSDFVTTLAKNKTKLREYGKTHTNLNSELNCFDQFNPTTKEEYDETLFNWSKAYLALAQSIKEKVETKNN